MNFGNVQHTHTHTLGKKLSSKNHLSKRFVETRPESYKDHSDTDEKMDDSGDDVDVFENVKKFFVSTG